MDLELEPISTLTSSLTSYVSSCKEEKLEHSQQRVKLGFFLQKCPGLSESASSNSRSNLRGRQTETGPDASEASVFGATGSIDTYGDLLCARPCSEQWGYREEERRPSPCAPRAEVLGDCPQRSNGLRYLELFTPCAQRVNSKT